MLSTGYRSAGCLMRIPVRMLPDCYLNRLHQNFHWGHSFSRKSTKQANFGSWKKPNMKYVLLSDVEQILPEPNLSIACSRPLYEFKKFKPVMEKTPYAMDSIASIELEHSLRRRQRHNCPKYVIPEYAEGGVKQTQESSIQLGDEEDSKVAEEIQFCKWGQQEKMGKLEEGSKTENITLNVPSHKSDHDKRSQESYRNTGQFVTEEIAEDDNDHDVKPEEQCPVNIKKERSEKESEHGCVEQRTYSQQKDGIEEQEEGNQNLESGIKQHDDGDSKDAEENTQLFKAVMEKTHCAMDGQASIDLQHSSRRRQRHNCPKCVIPEYGEGGVKQTQESSIQLGDEEDSKVAEEIQFCNFVQMEKLGKLEEGSKTEITTPNVLYHKSDHDRRSQESYGNTGQFVTEEIAEYNNDHHVKPEEENPVNGKIERSEKESKRGCVEQRTYPRQKEGIEVLEEGNQTLESGIRQNDDGDSKDAEEDAQLFKAVMEKTHCAMDGLASIDLQHSSRRRQRHNCPKYVIPEYGEGGVKQTQESSIQLGDEEDSKVAEEIQFCNFVQMEKLGKLEEGSKTEITTPNVPYHKSDHEKRSQESYGNTGQFVTEEIAEYNNDHHVTPEEENPVNGKIERSEKESKCGCVEQRTYPQQKEGIEVQEEGNQTLESGIKQKDDGDSKDAEEDAQLFKAVMEKTHCAMDGLASIDLQHSSRRRQRHNCPKYVIPEYGEGGVKQTQESSIQSGDEEDSKVAEEIQFCNFGQVEKLGKLEEGSKTEITTPNVPYHKSDHEKRSQESYGNTGQFVAEEIAEYNNDHHVKPEEENPVNGKIERSEKESKCGCVEQRTYPQQKEGIEVQEEGNQTLESGIKQNDDGDSKDAEEDAQLFKPVMEKTHCAMDCLASIDLQHSSRRRQRHNCPKYVIPEDGEGGVKQTQESSIQSGDEEDSKVAEEIQFCNFVQMEKLGKLEEGSKTEITAPNVPYHKSDHDKRSQKSYGNTGQFVTEEIAECNNDHHVKPEEENPVNGKIERSEKESTCGCFEQWTYPQQKEGIEVQEEGNQTLESGIRQNDDGDSKDAEEDAQLFKAVMEKTHCGMDCLASIDLQHSSRRRQRHNCPKCVIPEYGEGGLKQTQESSIQSGDEEDSKVAEEIQFCNSGQMVKLGKLEEGSKTEITTPNVPYHKSDHDKRSQVSYGNTGQFVTEEIAEYNNDHHVTPEEENPVNGKIERSEKESKCGCVEQRTYPQQKEGIEVQEEGNQTLESGIKQNDDGDSKDAEEDAQLFKAVMEKTHCAMDGQASIDLQHSSRRRQRHNCPKCVIPEYGEGGVKQTQESSIQSGDEEDSKVAEEIQFCNFGQMEKLGRLEEGSKTEITTPNVPYHKSDHDKRRQVSYGNTGQFVTEEVAEYNNDHHVKPEEENPVNGKIERSEKESKRGCVEQRTYPRQKEGIEVQEEGNQTLESGIKQNDDGDSKDAEEDAQLFKAVMEETHCGMDCLASIDLQHSSRRRQRHNCPKCVIPEYGEGGVKQTQESSIQSGDEEDSKVAEEIQFCNSGQMEKLGKLEEGSKTEITTPNVPYHKSDHDKRSQESYGNTGQFVTGEVAEYNNDHHVKPEEENPVNGKIERSEKESKCGCVEQRTYPQQKEGIEVQEEGNQTLESGIKQNDDGDSKDAEEDAQLFKAVMEKTHCAMDGQASIDLQHSSRRRQRHNCPKCVIPEYGEGGVKQIQESSIQSGDEEDSKVAEEIQFCNFVQMEKLGKLEEGSKTEITTPNVAYHKSDHDKRSQVSYGNTGQFVTEEIAEYNNDHHVKPEAENPVNGKIERSEMESKRGCVEQRTYPQQKEGIEVQEEGNQTLESGIKQNDDGDSKDAEEDAQLAGSWSMIWRKLVGFLLVFWNVCKEREQWRTSRKPLPYEKAKNTCSTSQLPDSAKVIPEDELCYTEEKVSDPSYLQRGHHVTMQGQIPLVQKIFGYRHHAIVLDVFFFSDQQIGLKLRHYQKVPFMHMQIVTTCKVYDLAKHDIHIISYTNPKFSPDEIVERALNYDKEIFKRFSIDCLNCESFCNWCSVGSTRSKQYERFINHFRKSI